MRERILHAIYRALEEINLQRSPDKALPRAEATALSDLDSLSIATFIVLVEQGIEEEFHRSINLLEDENLLDNFHNGQTVSSLAQSVERLLAS